MCDIWNAHCTICKCDMMIHIADFCTKRKNVHPYCPKCIGNINKRTAKVFADTITVDDNFQVDGGKLGEKVLILCDDPTAYGIHLN